MTTPFIFVQQGCFEVSRQFFPFTNNHIMLGTVNPVRSYQLSIYLAFLINVNYSIDTYRDDVMGFNISDRQ